jgi:CO/xanthine dehydrogenase FAD-binding subunit
LRKAWSARFVLAAASLAPFPTRLYELKPRCWARPLTRRNNAGRAALHCSAEVQPIDDIRSTAEYRRRVAANLLEGVFARVAPLRDWTR